MSGPAENAKVLQGLSDDLKASRTATQEDEPAQRIPGTAEGVAPPVSPDQVNTEEQDASQVVTAKAAPDEEQSDAPAKSTHHPRTATKSAPAKGSTADKA